jgi:hypothetical protein
MLFINRIIPLNSVHPNRNRIMTIKSFAKGLTLLVALILVGCGGGGGSSNVPTDTSLVFSVFPPGYFDGSYDVSYSLTGSSSDGENFTATLREQSGSTTVFNAQPVMTIDQQISITNTTTGATAAGSSEDYYSTDINNLTLVGSLNITDGNIMMATSTDIIPLTGSIGDFGNAGSYTLSDGTSVTLSWSLLDGFNGKAKEARTGVFRDSGGALEITEVDTYTISQDGTVSRLDIKITYHQLGNLVVTLSGS